MAADASTSNTASREMDPLRLLRHALTNKLPVELLDNENASSSTNASVSSFSAASYLSFPAPTSSSSDAPRIVLPKTTPTRFKRTPQSTASETWDLQALLLCYLQREASIAEYAQEAVKEGVELVGIMQRKIVADYLDGSNRDPAIAASYLVPESEGVNEDTSVEATLAAGSGVTDPNAAKTTQEALAEGEQAAAAASTSKATATTAAAAGQDAAGRPAKKARYQVNKEDLEAYKRIVAQFEPKQLGDRTTVLRGEGGKIVNFGNVRELISERLKAGKEELRKGTHSSGHNATAPAQPLVPSPGQGGRKRRQANPIILISPSSSALITMYNVKRFLEEAIYEPSDAARAAAAGRTAEDVIHINHKRQIGMTGAGDSAIREDGGLSGTNKDQRSIAGEKLTRYFVVDGVDALSKFGDDAWCVRLYYIRPPILIDSFCASQGPCRLRYDDRARMAVPAIQVF